MDQSRFQPADPQWTLLADWDTRAAWTGTDPRTVPARMEPPGSRQNQIAWLVIIYLVLVAACLLAWHNFRARRVDQRGAATMGAWFFVCMAAASLNAGVVRVS